LVIGVIYELIIALCTISIVEKTCNFSGVLVLIVLYSYSWIKVTCEHVKGVKVNVKIQGGKSC